MIGLGATPHKLAVYIKNRPMVEPYQSLHNMQPLAAAEISSIVNSTSNHWRKIFNVYAKLVFSCADFLDLPDFSTWQQLRDEYLLQASSELALVFSEPVLNTKAVKIITGHTYAQSLALNIKLENVGDDFLVSNQHKLIICPYFDYRQLSNSKIDQLTQIIKRFH